MATHDDPVRQMRELIDRAAITDALYTYCRAVDRVDRQLGYSIWHEGATVDYGPAIFVGPARGLIDHICTSHLKGLSHSHQLANILIRLDGDRAVSEAYVNSAMRMRHDGALIQVNTRGRYLDRWSRRDGAWKIVRRVFLCDLSESREVGEGLLPQGGAMGEGDASCALFAGAMKR